MDYGYGFYTKKVHGAFFSELKTHKEKHLWDFSVYEVCIVELNCVVEND